MKKNNGVINGRTLAIFLVVLSLVNIGILMMLRHNGTATTKEERESNEAMELYESADSEVPPDSENTDDSTENGITAEAPVIQEELTGEEGETEPSAVPTPAPTAVETAKPTATTEQSSGGPSLLYHEDRIPTVTEKDLDSLADLYIHAGAVEAKDSDGKDIADDIKGIYSADPSQPLRFYATFLVDDASGDRAKVDTSFHLKVTGPVVVLKNYSLRLNKGDDFDPETYVLYAVDENNNNLIGNVTYKGKVNTDKPGRYVIQYRCTSGDETFVTNMAVKVV